MAVQLIACGVPIGYGCQMRLFRHGKVVVMWSSFCPRGVMRGVRWGVWVFGGVLVVGCVAHRGPAPVYHPDAPVYYPPASGPAYYPPGYPQQPPPVVHHPPPVRPVYRPEQPPAHPQPIPQPQPMVNQDRLIEQQVWTALRADRQVDSRNLSLQVSNGVVMLGGYANTIAERDRALQAARRVPGVRNVVNQMTMN